jgi:hypothetical protein
LFTQRKALQKALKKVVGKKYRFCSKEKTQKKDFYWCKTKDLVTAQATVHAFLRDDKRFVESFFGFELLMRITHRIFPTSVAFPLCTSRPMPR